MEDKSKLQTEHPYAPFQAAHSRLLVPGPHPHGPGQSWPKPVRSDGPHWIPASPLSTAATTWAKHKLLPSVSPDWSGRSLRVLLSFTLTMTLPLRLIPAGNESQEGGPHTAAAVSILRGPRSRLTVLQQTHSTPPWASGEGPAARIAGDRPGSPREACILTGRQTKAIITNCG